MGFTYSTIPLHVKYLGPYLIPSKRNLKNEHSLYAALIEQLPKTAHFIQDFAPTVTNWLPFYWKNYQQTVRYTYIIALENLGEVYQNFNKSIKRNLKQAEKLVTIAHDISLVVYYAINKMSFENSTNNFFPMTYWGSFPSYEQQLAYFSQTMLPNYCPPQQGFIQFPPQEIVKENESSDKEKQP